MKLDRHTYEAWLLDRAEGNLSPVQEQQLDAFLADHPELEVPGGTLHKVHADPVTFPGKDLLRHTLPPTGAPDAAHLNDFLAARLEGDLSPEQENQLDRYLYEHPEAARDAAAMAKAKVAESSMHFDGRADLEKHFPPQGLPDALRLTDFLIAEAEGDLTLEQSEALGIYLSKYPEAKRDHRLVAAAHVQAEPVAYPWKRQLLKREVRILPLWTRWAAAASIALLLGLGWWFFQEGQRDGAGIAMQVQPVLHPPVASTQPATNQEAAPAAPAPVVAELPEARKGTDMRIPEKPVQHKQDQPSAPVKVEQGDKRPGAHTEPEPPAQPQHQPTPNKETEPALAQQPETHGQEEEPAKGIEPTAQPVAIAAASEGQSLGMFVVNKVRGKVLDAPQRATGLDGSDVLAMADRAISAVSGGQGGVQMQRSSTRERFRFSLGRNFSVSASRGR